MSATTAVRPNTIEEVTIGTQTWMLRNYDFAGSAYDDDIDYIAEYGKLYTWAEAVSIGASLDGWHLPTSTEWSTLVTYLGGSGLAGGALKETGLDHWTTPNEGATNSSGFTAVGSGFYDGVFTELKNQVKWWTATDSGTDAWTVGAVYTTDNIANALFDKTYKAAIRLIKD